MKPSDYQHLFSWNVMLGGGNFYIRSQQQRAANENAPVNAIHYSNVEKRWITADDLKPSHHFHAFHARRVAEKQEVKK